MKREPQLLSIRIYGDEVLRKTAEPVTSFDEKLKDFAQDLIFTMYQRDGVGLAAPQVGHSIRMFAVDTEWSAEDGKPNPVVMINPQITHKEGEISYEEGCISVPHIYSKVVRPSLIKYSYYDLDGKIHEETAEGYRAVAIQHEFDHLNGVLFIDHLSNLTRLRLKLKLKEIMKTTVDGVNIRSDIFVDQD